MLFMSAIGQVPELQNSENYKLLRLRYSNSSGEEAVTEFEYDAFGYLNHSKWTLLNGDRNSENTYVLDKEGHMIEKHRDFSDSMNTSQTFSYNLCGKLLHETYSRSDGTEGFVNYRYDDQGRLLAADGENMNGWFTGEIIYAYNAYEVIDKAVIRKDNQDIGEISYRYDINGNLKLEKWDFNGAWEQTFVYEYFVMPDQAYTSSNPFIHETGLYRVLEEYYEYTDGGAGPSLYEFVDDRLIKKTFNRSDGLRTETIYNYNDAGVLINASRTYSDGKKADISYDFDENRRMTRRLVKRSDGLKGEEIYIYDAEGRLVMATYSKMDAWLSGTIAFTHDQYGMPVKGYFKGDDHFDAEIYFVYDDNKNLEVIRWDFSFGKSQIYTFKHVALYKNNMMITTDL
jgi:hypothetical protein